MQTQLIQGCDTRQESAEISRQKGDCQSEVETECGASLALSLRAHKQEMPDTHTRKSEPEDDHKLDKVETATPSRYDGRPGWTTLILEAGMYVLALVLDEN